MEAVDLLCFGILEGSLSPGLLGHKIFWKIKLKGAERIFFFFLNQMYFPV